MLQFWGNSVIYHQSVPIPHSFSTVLQHFPLPPFSYFTLLGNLSCQRVTVHFIAPYLLPCSCFIWGGAYPECSRLTPGSAQRSLLGVAQGTLVMFREAHGMWGSNPAQPCTRQTPYLLFQLLFQTNGYRIFSR